MAFFFFREVHTNKTHSLCFECTVGDQQRNDASRDLLGGQETQGSPRTACLPSFSFFFWWSRISQILIFHMEEGRPWAPSFDTTLSSGCRQFPLRPQTGTTRHAR